jgi:starch phosphorylase
LNLSELDGWWVEAYTPEVGWAIGDGKDRGEDAAWDAVEADTLYARLEQEVVPCFYDRDEHGIPRKWVALMRESMARLTPAFSTNRTVRQYTEEHYLPLAAAYRGRVAEAGKQAAELLEWQRAIASQWQDLYFGSVAFQLRDGKYFYSVQVHLGGIKPDEVQVEIYAEPRDSEGPFLVPMTLDHAVPTAGVYQYSGAVPGDRPASDYTPRAIPRRPGAFIPLETALIAWQK